MQEPLDGQKQGRLAAAGVTRQTDTLAGSYCTGDIRQGRDGGAGLVVGKTVDFQYVTIHGRPGPLPVY